jgi:hypothetical protein
VTVQIISDLLAGGFVIVGLLLALVAVRTPSRTWPEHVTRGLYIVLGLYVSGMYVVRLAGLATTDEMIVFVRPAFFAMALLLLGQAVADKITREHK